MKSLNIAVTGGGTGGHATPAIAIAQEIVRVNPEVNVHYIGGRNSIEQRLASQSGYPFHSVWIASFNRSKMVSNLKLLFMIPLSLIQAIWYLIRFRIDLVIGTGGFAAFPACVAAKLLGRPLVLQEQNSYPGLVTRLTAKWAKRIYLGFDEARKHLPNNPKLFLTTGNPVQLNGRDSEIKSAFDFNKKRFTILVTGGSGGALSINKVIDNAKFELIERGFNLIWQTGKHWDGSMEIPDDLKGRLVMERFLDSGRMALAYETADLALSRCGATTLAELAIMGLPAILIPFPYSAEGHQEANARAIESSGAAVMILTSELTTESLLKTIDEVANVSRLETMATNMKKLAKPDAVIEIVEDIFKQL